MSREEHVEIIGKAIRMKKEEKNLMFDSGIFNEFILGAIALTLENMDFCKNDIQAIVLECKEITLARYEAEQLREAYNKL